MTTFESFSGTRLTMALGLTLMHSLWEIAGIAILLLVGLCFFRSPRMRYAAAYCSLLAMLTAFVLTLYRLIPASDSGLRHVAGRFARSPFEGYRFLPDAAAQLSVAGLLPWLTTLWVVGIVFLQCRSFVGWMTARRLLHRGVCCATDEWRERLCGLHARMQISKPVLLLETCLGHVPIVVGHVRPVILVPVGMLTGMPTAQVEGILLHELAHVRRNDYLANLFQTIIENLLFYHPAVWWISRVIRDEREKCCDDVVVAVSGNMHEYVTALASLEHKRVIENNAALAANGGSLLKRIRRLLYPRESSREISTPVVLAGILTFVTAVALMAWEPGSVKSDLLLLTNSQVAQRQTTHETQVEWSRKWLDEDVIYIISEQERDAFSHLTTDEERRQFVEQFWLRRDPTPGTGANEFKVEHYRRIAYAESHFHTGAAGWKTDRGRIYIMYGPPDEIESHPNGGAYTRPVIEGGGESITFPFEAWLYRSIPSVGTNVAMEFVDKTSSGDYRLTSDSRQKYRNP